MSDESKISGYGATEVKTLRPSFRRRRSSESDAHPRISDDNIEYDFLRHASLTPIHEENSISNERRNLRRKRCVSAFEMTPQARVEHIERNGDVSISELLAHHDVLDKQSWEQLLKQMKKLERRFADDKRKLINEKEKLREKCDVMEKGELMKQLKIKDKTIKDLKTEKQKLIDDRKRHEELEKKVKALEKQRSVDEQETQQFRDKVNRQLEEHDSDIKDVKDKFQLEGHSEPTVKAIQISETETAVPDGEDAAVEQASHVFDDN